MQILSYKQQQNSGSLKGFFELVIEVNLDKQLIPITLECKHFISKSGSSWCSGPDKPGKDTPDGKKSYFQIIQFLDKQTRDIFWRRVHDTLSQYLQTNIEPGPSIHEQPKDYPTKPPDEPPLDLDSLQPDEIPW